MSKISKILKNAVRPKAVQREYKHIRMFRIIYILVMGFFLFGFLQMLIFVHNRVYGSLQRVETIILLRSEIGAEAVDFDQLQRVADLWQKKYATTTKQIARDPFVAAPALTATTTP